jgi:hypothetical protein
MSIGVQILTLHRLRRRRIEVDGPLKRGLIARKSIEEYDDKIRRRSPNGRATTGNLRPLPKIFPDQVAPVVPISEGERELTMMCWGHAKPAAISRHHD